MDWLSDPTKIIAIATVAYTVLTIGILWAAAQNTRATRQILEAAHRPYLGVILVQTTLYHSDHADLCVTVQNVGTAPSRNVEINVQVSLNGRTFKSATVPAMALLPTQTHTVSCALTGKEVRILNPPQNIEMSIAIGYQGMTDKKYRTATTCHYTEVGKPFAITSAILE